MQHDDDESDDERVFGLGHFNARGRKRIALVLFYTIWYLLSKMYQFYAHSGFDSSELVLVDVEAPSTPRGSVTVKLIRLAIDGRLSLILDSQKLLRKLFGPNQGRI